LERLGPGVAAMESPAVVEAMPLPAPVRAAEPAVSAATQMNFQSLGALRGFSAILTHSLDGRAMLKQFLLLLRELIGINRAAIFLRQPASWMGTQLTLDDTRALRAACAIGLPPGLLEHFELSFNSGVGGQVTKLGRIVRR